MSETGAPLRWWTPEEFAVVKQELARPTLRRSALMRARVRFLDYKAEAKRNGTSFPEIFHNWFVDWQHCVKITEWRERLTKWRAWQKVKSNELTWEIVREFLDYNPATGVLTWRWRARRHFDD